MVTNSQALRYFYQKVICGKGHSLVGEGLFDEPGSIEGMANAAGTALKVSAMDSIAKNAIKRKIIIRKPRR